MRHPSYAALGLALLLALAFLHLVAPRGAPALLAGYLVVLLTLRPRPPRAARRADGGRRGVGAELRALLPSLALWVAAAASLTELAWLAAARDLGGGLAWFARTLVLAAAAWLGRTPPAALGLHGLAVVLALWTGATLVGEGSAAPLMLALAVVALGCAVHGLALARALELGDAAAARLATGVAPNPWGLRPTRLPAGAVALLALLPLGLGVQLPRLTGARPPPAEPAPPTAAAGSEPAPLPRRVVGFREDIALGSGRGALDLRDDLVARVVVTPDPGGGALLLRGTALARADDGGFFPGERPRADPPYQVERALELEVELMQPLGSSLLVLERPVAFYGVRPARSSAGPHLRQRQRGPLRYRVRCEQASVPPDAPAFRQEELLALPARVREDPRLRALAARLARGADTWAQARAVAGWVRDTCRYDAALPQPVGIDLRALSLRTLLEARAGVCEDFALATCALLRLAGVPARVAGGFRATERDEQGAFLVRARHAHAWVEVALVGAGWVALDPSPPNEAESLGATAARRREPRPASEAAPEDAPEAPGAEAPAAAPPALHPWAAPAGLAAAALAALGAALLGRWRVAQVVRSGHLARGAAPAPELRSERARFLALLEARGLHLDDARTVLEFVAGLEERGVCEPALAEAARCYLELRFSGRIEAGVLQRLRACLRRLR